MADPIQIQQIRATTEKLNGFTGKDGSAELRARLAKQLGLPLRITPKAMLDIINKAYGVDEYKKAAEKVRRSPV